MTVHVSGSVSVVVTHKLKIRMDAIVKALSTVMNLNIRNKTNKTARVQLRHSLLIKLLYSCNHFYFSSESNVCILNVVDKQMT